MAPPEFRKIKDDAELQDRLVKAVKETDQRVAKDPADPILSSFQAQLEAIGKWTANGRTPLPDEVRSLTLGLVAMREYEGPEPEYSFLLQSISGYIKLRAGISIHQVVLGKKKPPSTTP
jgi:hypothetical protein